MTAGVHEKVEFHSWSNAVSQFVLPTDCREARCRDQVSHLWTGNNAERQTVRPFNSPPLWDVSVTLWPSLSSTLTVRPVISSSSSSSSWLSPLHLYLPIKVCHALRHLPYVTGAHIRENNLWLPWIRDGTRFPMIRLWYENSLQYLDRGEASDRCSPACCRQTRVSETSCREHPGGPAGWREEEEEGEKVRGNGGNGVLFFFSSRLKAIYRNLRKPLKISLK